MLLSFTQNMSRTATTKYKAIRVGLLRRGHTVRSWALSKGYKPTTVYGAAKGLREGVVSHKIAKELEEMAK